ncbi:hypothetical protein HAX54_003440 [Datura stramonium]|uniref:Phytocyanin domain-containing protein n=1 Tax=Datura stramonium TaxID=4076 RepID=A0ABS8T625_DATST|nr:hypothetical protein [Datura stramonium]
MRFQINDSVLFKYKQGADSVLEVNKDDYDKLQHRQSNQEDGGWKLHFRVDRSAPKTPAPAAAPPSNGSSTPTTPSPMGHHLFWVLPPHHPKLRLLPLRHAPPQGSSTPGTPSAPSATSPAAASPKGSSTPSTPSPNGAPGSTPTGKSPTSSPTPAGSNVSPPSPATGGSITPVANAPSTSIQLLRHRLADHLEVLLHRRQADHLEVLHRRQADHLEVLHRQEDLLQDLREVLLRDPAAILHRTLILQLAHQKTQVHWQ